MRRIALIFGLVLIAGLIIHDAYEFFVTNEGIRYFSSKPARLPYMMLLGVAGGVVAFGISRLSPASQRKLKLLALGGLGTLLVAAVAFFGYVSYLYATTPLLEMQLWGWIAAAFCSVTVAAVIVWLEFRQVWRQAQ